MTAKRKIVTAKTPAKTPAKPYEPTPRERAAVDANLVKADEKPPAPWVKTEIKNGVVYVGNDHPDQSLEAHGNYKHGCRSIKSQEARRMVNALARLVRETIDCGAPPS